MPEAFAARPPGTDIEGGGAADRAPPPSRITTDPGQTIAPAVEHGVLRFPSIDGLRFWMAWWVVLGHAANLTGVSRLTPSFASPLFNAAIAVNVFVIVSGFVVTHLILSSPAPYGVYIGRRAARLWPIYLVALAMLIAFPQVYRFAFVDLPWPVFRGYDAARLHEVARHYPAHVGLHLLLLHGLLPDEALRYADSSILSPAWSLSLEWQFYLVAPLWIACMRRSRRAALTTGAIVLLGVAAFHAQDRLHWRFPAFLPLSAHFFLIGIVSRLAFERRWTIPRLSRYVGGAVLLSAAMLIVGDALLGFRIGRETAIWSCFYLFVLIENGRLAGAPPPWLRRCHALLGGNRLVTRLGACSYSTYILHIPVFALALYGASFFSDISTRSTAILVVIAAAIGVAPLSMLSYSFIEQPCNRLARRMLGGQPRRAA